MEEIEKVAGKVLSGCLREGENHRKTIGWRGGDCLTCVSDYIAEKTGRGFTPNSKCPEYIFCRYFFVN